MKSNKVTLEQVFGVWVTKKATDTHRLGQFPSPNTA
jgi:hypothetical protein